MPIQPTEGELRKLAVSVAGAKYRPGGRDRSSGLDGGGLASFLYKGVGMQVPAREEELASKGRRVGIEELQSWDLIVLAPGKSSGEAGIGIVLGGQDFIVVSKETGRVAIARLDEEAWKDRVVAARRLVDVPGAVVTLPEAEEPDSDGELEEDTDEPAESEQKTDEPPSYLISPKPKAKPAQASPAKVASPKNPKVGIASFYGGNDGFTGRKTSSGERLTNKCLTAAHRTLPFGTKLKVVNLANGKECVVRVNDRGPHRRGRLIDLSFAAAKRLGFIGQGLTKVRFEVL